MNVVRQQVNLYTAQFPLAEKKQRLPGKFILILLLILGACLLGAYLTYQDIEAKRGQLVKEQKLLDTITKTVSKMKSRSNKEEDDVKKKAFLALQDRLIVKKGVLNRLNQQVSLAASGFSERYAALSRQDINGLWLNSIEFDGDGNNVTLQGETMSPSLLADYLKRLSKEVSFTGVSFRVLTIGEPNAPEDVEEDVEADTQSQIQSLLASRGQAGAKTASQGSSKSGEKRTIKESLSFRVSTIETVEQIEISQPENPLAAFLKK